MREEELRMARRAQRAREDLRARDRAGEELSDVGFHQIQARSTHGRRRGEERVGVRELATERLHHIGADLVATRADRRTDGCKTVFRTRPEVFDHQAKRAFDDTSKRPPPSSVNGRTGARPHIQQEDGRAISRVNAQHDLARAREEGVADRWGLSP